MKRAAAVNRIGLAALALAGIGAGAGPALGQTFPADALWIPLRCQNGVMYDRYRDEAGALDERDIVGDSAAPAGLRSFDAAFLYLRLRLDQDPAPGGSLRPFSWGFELDTDSNSRTYEILVIVDGTSKVIALHRNSATTVADAPTDPADEPPVASYAFSTHGRSTAAGSSFGSNADFFLDLAVPWKDLAAVGLEPGTPSVAWVASSSSANSLDGDLACHDGSAGTPTLSATASDPVVPVPADRDTDRDGYTDQTEVAAGTDPNDPSSHPAGDPDAPLIAGGGGCTWAPGGLAPGSLPFLPLVLWLMLLALRSMQIPVRR